MSHAAHVSARPARTSSVGRSPIEPRSHAGANSVGTTYEMCLALEPDEPRLVRQFHRLGQAVVHQFPHDVGGTILFAGSGSSSHVADVAGYVAKQLTGESHSHVLLVDADATDRVLTQRFAAGTEKGLIESLHDGTLAARVVVSTAITRLAFLAYGEHSASRRPISALAVRDIVAEWKTSHRYTVVAAGTTVSPLTELLARYCDGTYLVVQLGRADKQHTSDTALQLTAAGARLLGSVATGVRP